MILAFFSSMGGSSWGGSEDLWATTAHDALAAGHRVLISVPRWQPRAPAIERLLHAGALVFERPRVHSKSLRRFIERVAFHRSFFSRQRPDVLCINQGGTFDFVTANHPNTLRDLTVGFRVPYVVLCHYNDEVFLRTQRLRDRVEPFLCRASRVGFVSEHNRRLVERQIARRLPNAVILRNPVNLSDTAAVPWRASSNPVRFCTVARLETRHKGQDVLLEALAGAAWGQRPWELRLYGRGSDRHYLERLARMLDIDDRVHFMGHVDDIRTVYADNDILVLSSFGEGIPLTLVEAMLCGRPAVVTDVGGNTEWLEEGTTGFIAAAATPQSVGAALERAWAARAQWRQIGERARAAALARYDPHPGHTLLGLLEQVARKNAPAAR
ncbi:MAG: glycosyltransferase family 4 protein [Candidatus Binatia bacterium]